MGKPAKKSIEKSLNDLVADINQKTAETLDDINVCHGKLVAALITAKEETDLIPSYIKVFRAARDAKDDIEEALKKISSVVEELRTKHLPEAFEAADSRTHTMANGDRVTINYRVTASIVGTLKNEAFKWLEDNDKGDIIQRTINSSTLSAFAGSLLEDGQELPDKYFKVNVLAQASLTRGKGSK